MKNYRLVRQWDHWLTQPLGERLLESEQGFLSTMLTEYYGKYAAVIGVPQQAMLLKDKHMSNSILLSPVVHHKKHEKQEEEQQEKHIESEFSQLAIASGSIDYVLLPHTLELVENPRAVLLEACRIVKPEGYLFIFGFNSLSLWGLKKWWMKKENMPWSNFFISSRDIKKWLALSDFKLVGQETLLFSLPFEVQAQLKRWMWIEWVSQKCFKPFGGVYALMAQSKVVPWTPIKLHWKQKFSAAPVTFPPSVIRNIR